MTNYTNQTANSTKTESKFEIRFNKNYTIATVSKEFKEQMFDYGSEAYNIAQNIRSFYPNITFRVASNHVQKTKKITYAAMKKHLKAKIALAEGEEKKELEKALAKFDAIKEFQRRWSEIGFVPIKQKETIQKQYKEVVDKLLSK